MSSISFVCHWLFTLFAEQTCAYKSFGDCIWIAVGWGTAVFKVALLFLANRSWNSYASTTVCHSSRELVDIGGLVMASQSSGIVQPSFRIVGTDMVLVSLGQPLNWLLNISKMKLNLISITKNHFMSALHCCGDGGMMQGFLSHTYFKPPSSRISLVLKLVWQPAPFQFPEMGFGSKEATTPKSSQTLCRRKRAIHKWSPMSMPSQGPTWNSHWRITKQLQQLISIFNWKMVF